MFQVRQTATLFLPLVGAAPLVAQSLDQEALQQDVQAASQAPGQQVQLQWGDFDADGLVDALAITPERNLKLMRNAGDGSFEDATEVSQLGAVAGASFGLWQDFDLDGQMDLFVGTQAGPCHLFRNVDGVFIDVATQLGIDAVGADRTARWVDYDEDGRMDLHLTYDQSNVFFHALPTGDFERVNLPAMLLDPANEAPVIFAQLVNETTESNIHAGDQAGQGHNFSDGQRQSLTAGGSSSSTGAAPSAGGQPGTSSGLGAPTVGGICATTLRDASGGDCLEANSMATFGMLYPLSDKFFIQESTGNVGVGTLSPQRSLHIESVGFWPLLIESSISPGMQLDNTAMPSSWAIYHDDLDNLNFRDSTDGVTRMTIDGDDGDVEIAERLHVDTITPSLTGLRVEGMVRAGSETGTDQPPTTAFDYQGVLTRRVASTTTTAGSVVAVSEYMRLVRNGSNGTFDLEWDDFGLNDQVAYGTGLTSTGDTIPIVMNLGSLSSSGSMPLFTNTDVVRLDLAFGTTFNVRELTEVTLVRSAGDFWWMGSLTSTVNQ